MNHNFAKYFIAAILCIFLAACQPAPEPEKPKGVLRIATIPTDMPIIVNGQPKGNSPSGDGQYFSISLEEGEHRIEILKSVNEEKEQYAEKTLFLAADTIPVVTLEAKERLTPFGVEEKARREAEAAEKARLAEIKRKKAAEIAAEKKRIAAAKAAEKMRKAEALALEKKRLQDIALQARLIMKGEKYRDVSTVEFSPDGNKVFSGMSWISKTWDANTGKLLSTKEFKGSRQSYATRNMSFTQNGDKASTASSSSDLLSSPVRTAMIFDANTGQNLTTLTGHSGDVRKARFSPDGQKIVTASWDNTAKIWDVNSGSLLSTLEGHKRDLSSADFSKDGSKIITTSDDHTAKIWNSQTGSLIMTLEGHKGSVYSGEFSRDGKKIVTNTYDEIKIWSAQSGSLLKTISAPKTYFRSARFSPNGTNIAASSQKLIRIWDSSSGAMIAKLDGHDDYIYSLAYSPNGKRLVSGDGNGVVIIRDVEKEISAQ